MKKQNILLYIAVLASCGCKPGVKTEAGNKESAAKTETLRVEDRSAQAPAFVKKIFTKRQAESILGEAADLTDSSMWNNKRIVDMKYTYTAKDSHAGRTGNVYFMLEMFQQEAKAHALYTSILEANKAHGITVIPDLGDEAYAHTDNENFYFLLARKGNILVRMKVNKLTPKTSRKAFDQVAKDIVNAI